VLVWQYLLGIELYWVVLALAIILLLAVGSDYNLLLISRFKEEIHAGLKTGIIRAMAGSGSVVTAAGLVFRRHHVRVRVQRPAGTRPDRHHHRPRSAVRPLIVRSFLTPTIATLLGRWFWWPLRVRPTAGQPDAAALWIAAPLFVSCCCGTTKTPR